MSYKYRCFWSSFGKKNAEVVKASWKMNLRKFVVEPPFCSTLCQAFCRYLRFFESSVLAQPLQMCHRGSWNFRQPGGEDIRDIEGIWGNQWEPCEWDAIQSRITRSISGKFGKNQLQLLLQKQNIGMEKHSKKQDLSYDFSDGFPMPFCWSSTTTKSCAGGKQNEEYRRCMKMSMFPINTLKEAHFFQGLWPHHWVSPPQSPLLFGVSFSAWHFKIALKYTKTLMDFEPRSSNHLLSKCVAHSQQTEMFVALPFEPAGSRLNHYAISAMPGGTSHHWASVEETWAKAEGGVPASGGHLKRRCLFSKVIWAASKTWLRRCSNPKVLSPPLSPRFRAQGFHFREPLLSSPAFAATFAVKCPYYLWL